MITSGSIPEVKIEPISREELDYYFAIFTGRLFRQLRAIYRRREREDGLTKKMIAQRLDADPAVITRRLNGNVNMTIATLNDLVRAMDCRIEAQIVDLVGDTARNAKPAPIRLILSNNTPSPAEGTASAATLSADWTTPSSHAAMLQTDTMRAVGQ